MGQPKAVLKGSESIREDVETKAMQGETLYKILCTQERKYGCKFLFCDKKDTGKEIIRILRDGL